MNDTPDTDAVDPDVIDQHTPVRESDDEESIEDSDRPLSADEIEQRRSVNYADDEY